MAMCATMDGPGLTNQDTRILYWIARGEPDKGIARRLYISEGTVNKHLGRIMERLEARTRAQAIFLALVSGVNLDDPQA